MSVQSPGVPRDAERAPERSAGAPSPEQPAPAGAPSRGVALVRTLALICLCALNLRTVVAAIGAGATEVERELAAGGAVTGTVSTVAVVLIGVAAVLALRVERWLGLRGVVATGLVLTVAAHAVLLVPGRWSIWAAVAAGGLGAGLLNTALPAVVRALLPTRAGLGIAVLMVGNSGGFFISSVVVPATMLRGHSWRQSALLLGAVAVLAVIAWATAPTARRAPGRAHAGVPPRLLAALRLPWVRILAAYIGIESALVFGKIAWLVPTVLSVDVSAGTAGVMLGLFTALQIVGGIGMPLLAQRYGRLALQCVLAAVGIAAGTAGVLLLLLGAGVDGPLPWIAVLVMAVGHGGSFGLVNFAVAELSRDARAAVGTGAAVMLVANVVGAVGPFLIGGARDVGGSYVLPWTILLVLAAVQIVLGWRAAPALRAARAARRATDRDR